MCTAGIKGREHDIIIVFPLAVNKCANKIIVLRHTNLRALWGTSNVGTRALKGMH